MLDGVAALNEESMTEASALFKPRSWLAKIDFINHLVLFNNLLITVLAENQGGKSSFSTLLETNLDQNIKSVRVKAKAPCDRQWLMHTLATQLHLNQDKLIDFPSVVAQVNERKAHVLFIIDDAQYLPEEFINEALLAIKSQGDFGFFHLCLIADYSVVPTLNGLVSDNANQLVHTLELGSLSEIETRTYVLQRAMHANLIKKPLTDQQFKRVYQLTKGNLALINTQLDSFIIEEPNNNKRTKTILKGVVAGVGATSLLGAFYVLVSTGLLPLVVKEGIPPIEDVQIQASTLRENVRFASQIPSLEDSSKRELVFVELPPIQALDEVAKTEVDAEPLLDNVVVIPKITTSMVLDAVTATAVEKPDLESKLVKIEGFSQDKTVLVAKIQSDKKRYTIQLAASPKQIDVNRLKQKNQLLAQTQVRHYKNAKGSWYILTLGEYDSIKNAQESVKQLPTGLTKLKPWVRPVSNLEQVG